MSQKCVKCITMRAFILIVFIIGILGGICMSILYVNSKIYQIEFLENWYREKAVEQGDNNLLLWQKCDKVGGTAEVLEPPPLGFYQWRCLGNDGSVLMTAEAVTWYS